MKNKIVTSLLILATSVSAVSAFADPADRYDDRNDQRHPEYSQNQHNDQRYQGNNQNQHYDQRYQGNNQNQHYDQRYQGNNQNQRDDRNHGQFNERNHHAPRYQQNHVEYRHDMPRPGHDWRKGQRVPTQYRGQGYYVNDWRDRELPAPPSGHRWLNVNGDYVLVAIATGIIGSILLGGGH